MPSAQELKRVCEALNAQIAEVEQAEHEVEEMVVSPLRSKGKGQAPVQESDLGEVTQVICDLCEKKGVSCRWGKVSTLFSSLPFFADLIDNRKWPAFGPVWAVNKPRQSARLVTWGWSRGSS